jgi:hypothetical protein
LKKNKYHILCARLLLLIFVAGQAILYGHQHGSNATALKVHPSAHQQTVTEKCQLCDAMHFSRATINHQVYFQPAAAGITLFIPDAYNFVSMSLILSAGRSPPLS